jgi:hypothetical protein
MLGIHSGGGGQPSVRGMPHMFRNASTAQDCDSLGLGLTREPSAPVIGKLQALTGQVTVTRANARITELVAGDFVYEGDLVETGHDGHVALLFADGTAFHLHADTRVVLDQFIFDSEKSPNSILLRVARGAFTFLTGKVATTGRLIVDTPVAQIRSVAPGAGMGSLAFGLLTFGLIHKLEAASADIGLVDDGAIDYKDLKHGVYVIHLKKPMRLPDHRRWRRHPIARRHDCQRRYCHRQRRSAESMPS